MDISLEQKLPLPREILMAMEEVIRAETVPGLISLDHEEVCPVTNHFAPGIYAREALIPKGVMAVGSIHKYEHLAMLSKGEVSLYSEEGIVLIKAPCMINSKPGVKRIAYAHEDSIFITFHPTDSQDIEEIRKEVIAESYEDFDQIGVLKCLG